MNDTLIKMVASQMGIPASVLDELKASKPRLAAAYFSESGTSTLDVNVSNPSGHFLVVITLPTAQLKRFPAIYDQAVKLAKA